MEKWYGTLKNNLVQKWQAMPLSKIFRRQMANKKAFMDDDHWYQKASFKNAGQKWPKSAVKNDERRNWKICRVWPKSGNALKKAQRYMHEDGRKKDEKPSLRDRFLLEKVRRAKRCGRKSTLFAKRPAAIKSADHRQKVRPSQKRSAPWRPTKTSSIVKKYVNRKVQAKIAATRTSVRCLADRFGIYSALMPDDGTAYPGAVLSWRLPDHAYLSKCLPTSLTTPCLSSAYRSLNKLSRLSLMLIARLCCLWRLLA